MQKVLCLEYLEKNGRGSAEEEEEQGLHVCGWQWQTFEQDDQAVEPSHGQDTRPDAVVQWNMYGRDCIYMNLHS